MRREATSSTPRRLAWASLSDLLLGHFAVVPRHCWLVSRYSSSCTNVRLSLSKDRLRTPKLRMTTLNTNNDLSRRPRAYKIGNYMTRASVDEDDSTS